MCYPAASVIIYQDLRYSGCQEKPNLMIVLLLYIVVKKM